MTDLYDGAKQVLERMDAPIPSWLVKGETPSFVTVDNKGTGHPMILLHGLFGALSNWDDVAPLMAEYTKPLAFQFPLLTSPRNDVKVKALAAYTWYYLKTKKFDPAILCGNSMGGHVAMRLYLADPSAVKCMILSGTSGLYEHTVDTLPIRPDHKFIREHMSRVFYNQKFVTEEAIEDIYSIIKHKKNVLNIINAARSAKKDYLLSLLKEIKCPVLLLWGEDDLVTTMDVAETFHKNIPNAKLVTIKNCGHAPMIEYPEWFSEQVKIFLQENSLVD
ncbi:MAG: alpha/beta hydrolase [Deltaproteobacteria bacterium]|nr:alpha/beta hydrolase [Deltaproteobacteria bacterium]